MPRRMTEKVRQRMRDIYELLKAKGPLSTSQIVKETRLTHSQIFYVLRLLQKEKKVREIKKGKVAYWEALI